MSLRRATRLFSTSLRHLNVPTTTASSLARSGTIPADLYLEPSKWKGLPADKIFQLYYERIVKLGPRYEPCQDELDALLSTAEHTGVTPRDIKTLYYKGESGLVDIIGIQKRDNYDPMPFEFDELPSQAQDLVADHREQRFYNRVAAYELPLLAQYRQEYKRFPKSTHPVTYKYTAYIGEEHPNAKKVVLQLKTADLGLDTKSLHKFRLLAKTRYNATTDVFKMSTERFNEPAQNARYLNDILQRLIKESKDMTDDFSDVPLDTRHTIAQNLRKKKRRYVFPEEWKRPQDAPKEMFNLAEELQNTLEK